VTYRIRHTRTFYKELASQVALAVTPSQNLKYTHVTGSNLPSPTGLHYIPPDSTIANEYDV